MSNQAADAWLSVEKDGRDIARNLTIGCYLTMWEDAEPMGEMLVAEVRKALRDRDLDLVSDDLGMIVVAREPS